MQDAFSKEEASGAVDVRCPAVSEKRIDRVLGQEGVNVMKVPYTSIEN
jgi:hypothetical protein